MRVLVVGIESTTTTSSSSSSSSFINYDSNEIMRMIIRQINEISPGQQDHPKEKISLPSDIDIIGYMQSDGLNTITINTIKMQAQLLKPDGIFFLSNDSPVEGYACIAKLTSKVDQELSQKRSSLAGRIPLPTRMMMSIVSNLEQYQIYEDTHPTSDSAVVEEKPLDIHDIDIAQETLEFCDLEKKYYFLQEHKWFTIPTIGWLRLPQKLHYNYLLNKQKKETTTELDPEKEFMKMMNLSMNIILSGINGIILYAKDLQKTSSPKNDASKDKENNSTDNKKKEEDVSNLHLEDILSSIKSGDIAAFGLKQKIIEFNPRPFDWNPDGIKFSRQKEEEEEKERLRIERKKKKQQEEEELRPYIEELERKEKEEEEERQRILLAKEEEDRKQREEEQKQEQRKIAEEKRKQQEEEERRELERLAREQEEEKKREEEEEEELERQRIVQEEEEEELRRLAEAEEAAAEAENRRQEEERLRNAEEEKTEKEQQEAEEQERLLAEEQERLLAEEQEQERLSIAEEKERKMKQQEEQQRLLAEEEEERLHLAKEEEEAAAAAAEEEEKRRQEEERLCMAEEEEEEETKKKQQQAEEEQQRLLEEQERQRIAKEKEAAEEEEAEEKRRHKEEQERLRLAKEEEEEELMKRQKDQEQQRLVEEEEEEEKKREREARRISKLDLSALQIQGAVRGLLARRKMLLKKQEREQELVRIAKERAFKLNRAKEEEEREKEREKERQERRQRELQSNNNTDNNNIDNDEEYNALQQRKKDWEELCAAVNIQSIARMYLQRCRNEKIEPVRKISSNWHVCRKISKYEFKTKWESQSHRDLRMKKAVAATRLQKNWRMYNEKSKYESTVEEREKRRKEEEEQRKVSIDRKVNNPSPVRKPRKLNIALKPTTPIKRTVPKRNKSCEFEDIFDKISFFDENGQKIERKIPPKKKIVYLDDNNTRRNVPNNDFKKPTRKKIVYLDSKFENANNDTNNNNSNDNSRHSCSSIRTENVQQQEKEDYSNNSNNDSTIVKSPMKKTQFVSSTSTPTASPKKYKRKSSVRKLSDLQTFF